MVSLLVVLALAGSAVAQNQSASVSLVLENPPQAQEITAGESVDLGVDVNLTVSGISCTQSVPLPMNVTAALSGSFPDNASHTATPGALEFTVPQGAHNSETSGTPLEEQGGPYNEVQTGTVSLETASGIRQGYTVNVELVAETPGATSEGCVPMEIPATTSDPVSVPVQVAADNPPDPGDDDGDELEGSPPGSNGTENTTSPPDEENGSPVPWFLAPLAAAGAAIAARRND